jgi:ABC-type uncharacterized transport system substrate-binding protein
VFWAVAFPVELGLVASLGRPGGNVTGVGYSAGPEIVTKLIELVAPSTARLAGLYEDSAIQKVLSGGLLSYGPDVRFELVVNLKTARALGLTIPPSVLIRADHTLE